MLWFLSIHIAASMFWCAALLYIPVLIAVDKGGSLLAVPGNRGSMARFIFTNIASPAALAAIIAGTLVFLMEQISGLWLIAKLTIVSGLVVLHALSGWLLLRVAQHPEKPVRNLCILLATAVTALILATLWMVLAKPELRGLA